MKNILFGIGLTLFVFGIVFGGMRIVRWRAYVNEQSWKSTLTFDYLSEPVFKTKDGRVFTRAQALDYLLADAIKNKK